MSEKKEKFLFVLIIFIIICSVSVGSVFGYRLYEYVQLQDAKIDSQTSEIEELKDQITELNTKLEETPVEWNDYGFNYLAIGNSITVHGYADYWWDDDRGMASSDDSKDYVHLVKSYLEENDKDVTMHTKNMAEWETNVNDRSEFLSSLDSYLSKNLNLVTIQVGENVTDLSSWESDFEELISYIRERAPYAQIIVVGDFWSYQNRDYLKETATYAQNAEYVSLYGIKDNSYYYAGLGSYVKGNDGQWHIIEHSGVAKHPGDRGMAAIAERISEVINL